MRSAACSTCEAPCPGTATPSCGCARAHARSGRATARYERKDTYYRRARAEGYRSRAAYKLRELLAGLPQVRRGSAVVELGCWPGGWLQVLADRVGPAGRVLGVDLREVDPLPAPVETLVLDLVAEGAPERVAAALGRPADAVLSDAASALSGLRDVDRAAQEELHDAVLAVALRVLRPGGALVVKSFPGPEADRFRAELRARLGRVRAVRTGATRSTSRELYLVASG